MMHKICLASCIPSRMMKSEARALSARTNRNVSEWRFKTSGYSAWEKKELLARMLQVATLVLMSTSIYSFGGKMYQQNGGAGIGERASAVLAKVTMAIWDILWTNGQRGVNLTVHMYFRYIDDLRILLAPINPGWTWTNRRWVYNKDMNDDRSADQRTKEEILKTLNEVITTLKFTVETQEEYESGYMPTLDTQTRVGKNRKISFKYYSKPMASNLVIQLGTALSQQTIFSSLRQDLCRRLGNTGTMEGSEVKLSIIESFIQQMRNSGHKFQFIKSVVLQAVTKYEYMLERDKLKPSNKRYCPFYRTREYNKIERIMVKRVGAVTWFTDEKLDDPFKQGWKGRVKRKGHFNKMRKRAGI